MRYNLSNNTKTLLDKCREYIFISDNFEMAEEIIDTLLASPNKDEIYFIKYHLGMLYLENLQLHEAKHIFLEIDEKYQAGYCAMLLGDIDAASFLWNESPDCCPVIWGKCLLNLLSYNFHKFPTFLQVRNYMERDLSYFIKANRLDFANNLIECGQVLVSINLEAYKYIGRTLLSNNYPNLGMKYLIKSQEVLPQDPEVYFHLAEYSLQINQLFECKNFLKKALNINESYTPAEQLLLVCEQAIKGE